MARRRRFLWPALLLVAAAASIGAAAPPAAEPVPPAADAAVTEPAPPALGPTNLELFASLDDTGQCLLRSSVFPAGGVGFADSSLPYDDLSPEDRAYSTARAEIIRSGLNDIAGISEERDADGRLRTLVVHAVPGSTAVEKGVASLVERGRGELRAAVDALAGRGVGIEVRADAGYSLRTVCATRDRVLESLGREILDAGVATGEDADTGRVSVTVQPGYGKAAEAALRAFGDTVVVDEFAAEMGRSGRADSYAPRRGGSRVSASGYGTCSTSFRFNGTALLTAGHCGSQYGATTWRSPNGAVSAGTTDAWNFLGAGYDIRLLYGSTYGNRIWTGGSAGSGLVTGTGYVGVGSVSPGGYYLMSGGMWGQATLRITDIAGPTRCYYDILGASCYLYTAHASGNANACRAGDSGSPWGLYNGGAGTLAALAIHAIGPVSAGTSPIVCDGTSVQHLIVALGGGTIG